MSLLPILAPSVLASLLAFPAPQAEVTAQPESLLDRLGLAAPDGNQPTNGPLAMGGEAASTGISAAAAEFDEAFRTRVLEAEFGWRQMTMEHRLATFSWQLIASKIVFWGVLSVVATGLWFSWKQFQIPSRKGRSPAAPAPLAVHEFKAELGPIKLSATSPVLGVIVLTISIVFFYLYLTEVYPIREVGG